MADLAKRRFSRLCGAKEKRRFIPVSSESEPRGEEAGAGRRTARFETHPSIPEITA